MESLTSKDVMNVKRNMGITNMKNKNYHRLRYEEILDISEKHEGKQLTCGFMREMYYNSDNNHIIGFCYFREDLGLGLCKKNTSFRAEDCEIFQRQKESKLKEIA